MFIKDCEVFHDKVPTHLLTLICNLSANPSPNSRHMCLPSVPWAFPGFLSPYSRPICYFLCPTTFCTVRFFCFCFCFCQVDPSASFKTNLKLSLSQRPSQSTKSEPVLFFFFIPPCSSPYDFQQLVLCFVFFFFNICKFQKNREHICFIQNSML